MSSHLNKAIRHIEKDPNDSFDIGVLAKKAGYSKFHFARVFKTNVGESVMEYVKRLRIEKSALKILYPSAVNNSVFEFGFETTSGFYKAFKKRFGITPLEYKKNKIEFWRGFVTKLKETPIIVYREEQYVVFERAIGEYDKSTDKAWESLLRKLNQLDVKLQNEPDMTLTIAGADLIGICHDDPTVTDSHRIRYDACIAWGKKEIDFLARNGLEVKKIASGRYAKVVEGELEDDSLESWFGLCGWVIENGYIFGSEPPFERYINIRNNGLEQVFDTELYIHVLE